MTKRREGRRLPAVSDTADDERTSPTTIVQERTYASIALGHTQPYVCLLPRSAEKSGRKYGLIILLHGHGGGRHDWIRLTRIGRYLAAAKVIVVCPDGANGWYTNAVDGGERREDDIIHDLLPHLEGTLPLLPPPARAIAGLSMGGYGAIKLALKHPHHFGIAASHSGALGISTRPSAHPVFGDAETHAAFRRQEDVYWLAEQALCRSPLERPNILLDCGASDPMANESRAFSDHLNFIGYGHTYREMPGHHTWPYWDRAFRTALPEILRHVGAADPVEIEIAGTGTGVDSSRNT